MVDQNAQSDVRPRSSDHQADALRELADAIRVLAGAIRESAAFADLELVPCDQVEGEPQLGEDDVEDDDVPCSRVLPLVPAQERRESSQDGGLCRPGGCRCHDAESGQGRHARREPNLAAVAAGCCRGGEAGNR